MLKACDAGIPVVNVDEVMDTDAIREGGGNIVGTYTTDNVAVGAQGAEFICSKIESGEVAIIEGTAGNVNSNARTPVSYTHLDVYKRQVSQRHMQKKGQTL